jgi:hypothetical protein
VVTHCQPLTSTALNSFFASTDSSTPQPSVSKSLYIPLN